MNTAEPGLFAKRRRVLIFVSAIGVLAYMGLAIAVDARRLETALVQLGIAGCGSVLALSALNYVLRFQRWHGYVREFGHHIPWSRHLMYYLSGFAFTVSPGKAGEAVRSFYLRDHGVSYSESLATLFVERLLDLLAIVLLATLLVLDHPTYRPLVLIMSGVTVVAVMAATSSSIHGWLSRLSSRQPGRLGRWLAHAANLTVSSARLLRPKLLTGGAVLGVIAWGAEGAGLYLICEALQLDVGLASAIGIYSVAALAGTAALFLPGGIGGMEFVMTALLVQAGAPLSTAVLATLLCRLATLWFAVVIGVVAASAAEFSAPRRASANATS